VACAAAFALAFACLTRDDTRDETREAPAAAGVLSAAARAAATTGEAATVRAGIVGVRVQDGVRVLDEFGTAGDAPGRAAGSADRDALESASEESTERGAAPLEEPGDAATTVPLRAVIARARKPSREAVLATRLGWTDGDGREGRLAAWLEAGHAKSAADLVPLFGPVDAAAIARDLAPLPACDER